MEMSRVLRIVINITMYKILPLPLAIIGSIVIGIISNKVSNLS